MSCHKQLCLMRLHSLIKHTSSMNRQAKICLHISKLNVFKQNLLRKPLITIQMIYLA